MARMNSHAQSTSSKLKFEKTFYEILGVDKEKEEPENKKERLKVYEQLLFPVGNGACRDVLDFCFCRRVVHRPFGGAASLGGACCTVL